MKSIKKIIQSVWRRTLKYPWQRCICWYKRRMGDERRIRYIKRKYGQKTGKILNLENPQTFNEKIQWSKLNDRNPMKTKLADKYAVRQWVAEIIGEEYLIPLPGVWESADDIDFDALPEQFVLKTNHGSHWNIIARDKTKLNVKSVRRQLNHWLRLNTAYLYSFEMQYADIEPRIIAEAYMEDASCGELPDYKFFCFSGKPYYCQVDVDRFAGHKRNIYDLEWNLLPLEYNNPNSDRIINKPESFDEMINIAGKLSEGFTFVRVDLYNINGKIYFGEMTFTPEAGSGYFSPPEYDAIFGDLWEID